jgi:hypothetical protein
MGHETRYHQAQQMAETFHKSNKEYDWRNDWSAYRDWRQTNPPSSVSLSVSRPSIVSRLCMSVKRMVSR